MPTRFYLIKINKSPITGPDPDLKSDRCIYYKSARARSLARGDLGECTPEKNCFDQFSELHSPAF